TPLLRERWKHREGRELRENLESYLFVLRTLTRQIREVIGRTGGSLDQGLLDRLEMASGDLRKAVEGSSTKPLDRIAPLFDDLLVTVPPRINAQLKAAAEGLGLPELIGALEQVSKNVHAAAGDTGLKQVAPLQEIARQLNGLNPRLTVLVAEHDR